MYALARLRAWVVLDEDRQIRADVTLADLATNLATNLEERHNIYVTAVLDTKIEDMARRILGSRLLSVEPTEVSTSVQITVGYEQLDAVRQLLQFAEKIEVTDPPEARALIASLTRTIATRHRDAASR